MRVDLHSHSIISYDGSITEVQYKKLIDTKIIDCIAITDHNETRFARMMQEKYGGQFIIGEEITTTDGEIIGLFLKKTVKPGMSAKETADAIHEQEGVVYVPHPFETFRKGVQARVLQEIYSSVDIIEMFNGRGKWRGKPQAAEAFAHDFQLPGAASSDAHCPAGLGTAYSIIDGFPSRKTLVSLLEKAELHKEHAPLWSLLCPTVNKIKNKIILSK